MNIKTDGNLVPFLKWAGGKRQLLPQLTTLLPKDFTVYSEPFLGGGALLFKCKPKTAIVNDLNDELINAYRVVRDNLEPLIDDLKSHKNEKEYYYKIRAWDRDKEKYRNLSKIKKASRIIYLNKTCYNGLYRVNKAGEFNVPFGSYKNPAILDEKVLRRVSRYLGENSITLTSKDYGEALERLPEGAFVYLDPPYHPISSTSNFSGYVRGGFGKKDQIRLKEHCDDLDRRGIKFMLSNSKTSFIKKEYSKYDITAVKARRAVNSVAAKRGPIQEVIIRNYA